MLAYHVLKNSVVLNYDGKTEVVADEDSRFEKILECIRENRLDEIPAIVDLVATITAKGFEVVDGLIHIDGEALPDALSKRILNYQELDLPYDSLLKFWDNVKLNPSFNSRKMLFDFLQHNGHPLTEDGCFIAYRGVTNEFKDCRTGTFDNSIGSVCEMDRSLVDDNPENTCSSGLHVACHDYANSFGSKTVEVKVNPKDVVAVPRDYNGTKMRVCKFEVVALSNSMRTEELYSEPYEDYSDYDCDDVTGYGF